MNQKSSEGQGALFETVIKKGMCVACGACVDLCPYFSYFDGRVILMDACRAEEGRCFKWCPQAVSGMELIDLVEKRPMEGSEGIGPYIAVFSARAHDEKKRATAQNGGVATTLLEVALEKGIISSAIVTGNGTDGPPSGKIVDTPEDVAALSGSRYSASAALSALNRAEKSGMAQIGVTGLPCQMAALERRNRDLTGKGMKDPVVLRIGLFCTWALDYRKLSAYLKEKGLEGPILKSDIPPPPAEIFRVHTTKGVFDYPLPEIRNLIQKGCLVCMDMTSLHADISIGAFEGREGWNTVIVRTETGKRVFDQARSMGRIEAEPFPEENLSGVNRAAIGKKNRGEACYREMMGGETRE